MQRGGILRNVLPARAGQGVNYYLTYTAQFASTALQLDVQAASIHHSVRSSRELESATVLSMLSVPLRAVLVRAA